MKKLNMVCSSCGSHNVLRDAYVEWNVEAQDWEIRSVFDASICDDCGAEGCIEEVEEK